MDYNNVEGGQSVMKKKRGNCLEGGPPKKCHSTTAQFSHTIFSDLFANFGSVQCVCIRTLRRLRISWVLGLFSRKTTVGIRNTDLVQL